MAIIDELLRIIHDSASKISTFDDRLGPGKDKGNGATTLFVRSVNELVRGKWPTEVVIDQPAIPKAGLDFDFYVPSEQTAVEIALGIRNPVSEYEKDIFKALRAVEHGLPLRRLILIGKSGSVKTRSMPGSKVIREWAQAKSGLKIEVHEVRKVLVSAFVDGLGDAANEGGKTSASGEALLPR